MAKRLATWLFSAIRWMGRQVLMSLLIVAGAAVGWFGRKATGPALVSEQVHVRSVARTGARPAPVVPTDPAARAWLEEATSLTSPSASLLRLRQQLEAGEISDFGRLARAMLCHPLPLFRREALSALVSAWGRQEPAEAMTFILEHRLELEEDVGKPGEAAHNFIAHQLIGIAHSWAGKDPLAAMTFLTPAVCQQMALQWDDMIGMAFEPGAAGTPGLIERINHLRSLYGESALKQFNLWAAVADGPWAKAGRAPSADDWRTLADSVTHELFKSQYLSAAMHAWQQETGAAANADGLRAWLGNPLPPLVEADVVFHSNDSQALAAFLRSAKSLEIPDVHRRSHFYRLVQSDPELARELIRDGVLAGVVDAATLSKSIRWREESDLQAWLQVLPETSEREEFLRNWMQSSSRSTDRATLETDVARALSNGPEGDVLAVGLLGRQVGMAAGEVLDIFSNLAPDVQSRTRMDLVLEVGRNAPDVAAELWMDATPGELAQPGAGAVAEELAARLLRHDPEVASAWIQQLPPGESRDRAVARMIERTAAADPATCAEWAATLVDPMAQARARAALEAAATKNARR